MSQEFWLGFFERKASSRRKISSLSLNGFRDFQQARRIRLSVLNIIQSVRPSAVVDCGCGDGSVAMLISQYCKYVLGVEISPSMCEIAKKKHSNIVNSSMHSFLDSNSKLSNCLQQLPSQNILFLFCESLVCIDNPNQLLEAFGKNLPNIRHFLISSPNKESFVRKIFTASDTSELRYLDFESMEDSMSRNNYILTDKIYIIAIPFIYSIAIPGLAIKSPIIRKLLNKVSNNIICLYSIPN